MNTREVPLLASISWIRNAFHLIARRPLAVFVGAAILSLLTTIPAWIEYLLKYFIPAGDTLQYVMALVGAAFLFLVWLPMFGGYFRLMHRVAHEPETARWSPAHLMEPYSIQRMALRLAGFFILFALGYGLVLALFRWVGLPDDFLQRPTLTDIKLMPLLVTGFMMALITALLGIGLGEIAVANHKVSDAFGTGFRGFVKNFKTFFTGALLIPILAAVVMLIWSGVVFLILWPISKLPSATTELAVGLISWLSSLPFVAFLFALLYSVWQDVVAAEIVHDEII